MKKAVAFALVALLLAAAGTALLDAEEETTMSQQETEFDSALAAKLGADEYGMCKYVLAFLKTGPNRDRTEEESAALMRAHLDNIIRMWEEGTLLVSGPFLDKGDIRGIYIFNVQTIEEAKALTETDPAIKAGSLEMELHPWYGSAALQLLMDQHKKVAKKGI